MNWKAILQHDIFTESIESVSYDWIISPNERAAGNQDET